MASGWYLVVARLATMAAWARGNFDAVVTMGCVGDGLDSELLLLRHHWTYAPSSPLQPPAVVVMGFNFFSAQHHDVPDRHQVSSRALDENLVLFRWQWHTNVRTFLEVLFFY
uniref:Secreted protein n=2 Tax=Oryza TaxID=4527 RepID=A0A0D3EZJ2_9ORYZ